MCKLWVQYITTLKAVNNILLDAFLTHYMRNLRNLGDPCKLAIKFPPSHLSFGTLPHMQTTTEYPWGILKVLVHACKEKDHHQ